MKNSTCSYLKTTIAAGALLAMSANANAATFTALASGNFSAGATWVGGIAPAFLLSTDVVVIPSGITVTLDNNATLNGALGGLTVNGSLVSSNNSYLTLNTGTLSGAGTITVDSLALAISSGVNYTGTITARAISSTGATISSNANITANGMLDLQGSTLNVNSGTLTLGAGATLRRSGGSLSNGGGSIVLTNNYSLWYTSTSTNTGLELNGSGLTNITVDVPAGNTVTLTGDMYVKGMLTLMSGSIDMNNRNITFTSTGNFSAMGNGNISASTPSNIIIMSGADFDGGLRFSSSANTFHNLTVNLGNSGSTAKIGSDIVLQGTLNLQSGKLDIGMNDLKIDAGMGGMLSGGSSSSYVVTGTGGTLTMALAASGTNNYHIGTSSNYAPAILIGNSGSVNGDVSVGVNPTVMSEGNTGVNLSSDQPVVDATWFVSSTVSGTLDINMEYMWSTNMEINAFNRASAYVSHYTNGNWDVTATAAATAASNGMFSLTRNNVTSLSPFAVVGGNAITTSVNNVAANTAITVYPNPTAKVLNIKANGNPTHAQVYDYSGRLVLSVPVINNSVIVDQLPAGLYTARFTGNGFVAVEKFSKQ
jgi:hypothetical protein